MSSEVKKKAVVLDDDTMLLTLYEKMLEKIGYEPIVTASYTDFRKVLDSEGPFDVFIIDLTLSDVDVTELTSKLKEEYPNTGLIVVSGYPYDPSDRRFAGLVFDTFLQKPFTFNTLKDILTGKSDGN